MKKLINPIIKASLVVYPRLCEACKQNVDDEVALICVECRLTLPRTNFHLHKDNPVMKVFWGRIPLEYAFSFLYFVKESRSQKLMHALKYKGLKEIGQITGQWFGEDVNKHKAVADSIDIVLPVPLHPKKLKKRGYNQSEYIARGIAQGMKKDLSVDNLIRLKHTDTQTRKSRFHRWENVSGIFDVKDVSLFESKHLLLVDDVITTGSTIEACFLALKQCKGLKLSVASLAFAHV